MHEFQKTARYGRFLQFIHKRMHPEGKAVRLQSRTGSAASLEDGTLTKILGFGILPLSPYRPDESGGAA